MQLGIALDKLHSPQGSDPLVVKGPREGRSSMESDELLAGLQLDSQWVNLRLSGNSARGGRSVNKGEGPSYSIAPVAELISNDE